MAREPSHCVDALLLVHSSHQQPVGRRFSVGVLETAEDGAETVMRALTVGFARRVGAEASTSRLFDLLTPSHAGPVKADGRNSGVSRAARRCVVVKSGGGERRSGGGGAEEESSSPKRCGLCVLFGPVRPDACQCFSTLPWDASALDKLLQRLRDKPVKGVLAPAAAEIGLGFASLGLGDGLKMMGYSAVAVAVVNAAVQLLLHWF